jgi:hypothetical protein
MSDPEMTAKKLLCGCDQCKSIDKLLHKGGKGSAIIGDVRDAEVLKIQENDSNDRS